VYYIDAMMLGLANGLHTISWDVTDSGSQTAYGIGSRFFNVVASSGDVAEGSRTLPEVRVARVASGFSRTVDVSVASGFSRTIPDASGRRFVQFPIGGRLQLDLGGPVDAGYQEVEGARRALPIGSTLDAAAGTFAWEPPAGFFGPFALVFTTGDERLDVTVTIVDGTRAPAPIAMQIDAPLDGSIVSGALLVGGWALDPQAPTGIDAVHVWAVRRDVAAASPQFLGAATLDLARPDVAQAFGARFHATGFQLTTAPVAPGSYDVTVYARSARTGRWEVAQTVHVTAR
jgi:hypothetical protein